MSVVLETKTQSEEKRNEKNPDTENTRKYFIYLISQEEYETK